MLVSVPAEEPMDTNIPFSGVLLRDGAARSRGRTAWKRRTGPITLIS